MTEKEVNLKNRIKELRKAKKLSQEELANKLGISRQSIIALEQGKNMPSLPLAFSVCKFFDSAFEEMFQLHSEIEDEMNKAFSNRLGINIHNSHPSDERREIKMTELEPWRPLRESVSLRDAMDRLFEDSVISSKSTGTGMPKIDVKDTKNEIVIKAELPGIAEEDVDVEICDGVVTISGQKSEEKEEEGEGYYHKESHSGAFSRSVSLPAEVDAEKAKADMENGILILTLIKIQPKKAKKISLKPKKK